VWKHLQCSKVVLEPAVLLDYISHCTALYVHNTDNPQLKNNRKITIINPKGFGKVGSEKTLIPELLKSVYISEASI